MRRVWKCAYLCMTEFDYHEVTLCSWQDVKIQLLTNHGPMIVQLVIAVLTSSQIT